MTAATVYVCLPTYNERQNLERMVRSLGPFGVRVLIVDDHSPDGTGVLADTLAAQLPYVDVLHRSEKAGLGAAYVAGFRRALGDGAQLIVQMDCDFSHAPADVPRLLAAASEADLVLGSRYVAGGSIGNWGYLRRTISKVGSHYARGILGIPVRDLTGGFKCYHRRVLETIDLDGIHAKGYAFQIETTFRTFRAGFRVREIPIHFADREAGVSKMTPLIVAEAIWKVPALRLRPLRTQTSADTLNVAH